MSFKSFDEMLKNASNKDNIKKLQEKLEKTEGGFGNDPTYFKLKKDAAGNGNATIRFLPEPKGEESPFVVMYSHFFKGPTGKYYIENSRTTIGEQDPVSEANSILYNSGDESDKKTATKQKRRKHYHSNIYVIKHASNPEDEGKVFKFAYGQKIFDKIKSVMKPVDDDEVPIDPFNILEGANFRLRTKIVEDYPNYDDSKFDSPSPLSDDLQKLRKIWESCYSLEEIVSLNNFKSYDELKKKYESVTGQIISSSKSDEAFEPKSRTSILNDDLNNEKTVKSSKSTNDKFADDDFNIDDLDLN